MMEPPASDQPLRIVFHQFVMRYAEDVEIYVAEPIYQWQQTEHGKWVMTHAKDVSWTQSLDPQTFGHKITIYGWLQPVLATEYLLRYGSYNPLS